MKKKKTPQIGNNLKMGSVKIFFKSHMIDIKSEMRL